jgi:hypothetical protein
MSDEKSDNVHSTPVAKYIPNQVTDLKSLQKATEEDQRFSFGVTDPSIRFNEKQKHYEEEQDNLSEDMEVEMGVGIKRLNYLDRINEEDESRLSSVEEKKVEKKKIKYGDIMVKEFEEEEEFDEQEEFEEENEEYADQHRQYAERTSDDIRRAIMDKNETIKQFYSNVNLQVLKSREKQPVGLQRLSKNKATKNQILIK